MPRLIVESNPAIGAPLAFTSDPGDLLALIAFGYAEPFGSQHPLTVFLRRLKNERGVDVTPLVTFYDQDIQDDEDAANLEAAWQAPAPLATAARAAAGFLQSGASSDAGLGQIAAEYPDLAGLLLELADLSDEVTGAGAQIRLSFRMD